jgi:hypothetical protein
MEYRIKWYESIFTGKKFPGIYAIPMTDMEDDGPVEFFTSIITNEIVVYYGFNLGFSTQPEIDGMKVENTINSELKRDDLRYIWRKYFYDCQGSVTDVRYRDIFDEEGKAVECGEQSMVEFIRDGNCVLFSNFKNYGFIEKDNHILIQCKNNYGIATIIK